MEYNRIVNEPSKQIRAIAREALRGQWGGMFVAMLVYYLVTNFAQDVLDHFFTMPTPNYDVITEILGPQFHVSPTTGFGGGIYSFLLSGAFSLGLAYFTLTFLRTRQIDNGLFFEGFSNFGKAFWLSVLMAIKVILWSLLFIIPGIIAIYRYSMAFYVLADNPGWRAKDCIRESCRLMVGNKWKLFCLQLSFIGWSILAAIPGGIISEVVHTDSFAMVFVSLICSLPYIYLNGYMNTAEGVFYDLASEHLVIVRTEVGENPANDCNAEPKDQSDFTTYTNGNENGGNSYNEVSAQNVDYNVDYNEVTPDMTVTDNTESINEVVDAEYTENIDEVVDVDYTEVASDAEETVDSEPGNDENDDKEF